MRIRVWSIAALAIMALLGCASRSTAHYRPRERALELARRVCAGFDLLGEPREGPEGVMSCHSIHGFWFVVEVKPDLLRVTGHRDAQLQFALRLGELASQLGIEVEYVGP